MVNNSNKPKRLASALALAAILISGYAFADSSGVNSIGDSLPIGAGGTPVLTITGSTKSSQFNGPIMLGNVQSNPNLAWACNSSSAGSMRYNKGVFEGCNGTSWGPLGGSSFSIVSTVSPTANKRYQNTTGGALFLSSLCPNSPNFSGYRESIDYYIYDTNGNEVGDSHGQIAEGGSDGNFNAAPYASAIIPAGYYWSTQAVFYKTVSSCTTSVAASVPYSL